MLIFWSFLDRSAAPGFQSWIGAVMIGVKNFWLLLRSCSEKFDSYFAPTPIVLKMLNSDSCFDSC